MSARHISIGVLVTVVLAVDVARAQAPAEASAPRPASSAPPVSPDGAPAPPSNYQYEPEGRRDPFISLASRGTDGKTVQVNGVRPDGLAGVMVDELIVRGVVHSRGAWMAIVAGTSGRAYSIRPGDRLMDGSVLTITSEAVVLMQDVNDPLSLAKQREVRKYLRGEVR